MTRLIHGKVGSKSINDVLDVVLPTEAAAAPVNAVASQGTLTIAEPVTADNTMTIGTTVYTFKASVTGVKSAGTLTIAEPVTIDNTMTIGTTVYTFKAGATAAAGQIGIGGNEAATKLAVVAAINGTDTFNTAHPLVSAAAWPSGDTCVITAKATGTAGNAIATTETFTHVSNIFDDTTLGTTTAGVDATHGTAGQIGLGESEAVTKLNIVSAINGGDEFASNLGHPLVTAADFSGDACVLTAREKGTAGDLIATTETFTHASNIFDDTTLGTTTAGVDATPGEVTEMLYDATHLYMCTERNGTWRKVLHSAL